MAAPQEFHEQAEPVRGTNRMQQGGREKRQGSRIQGGWAPAAQPQGHLRGRGRGRSLGRSRGRGRGYQPPGPRPDYRCQGSNYQELPSGQGMRQVHHGDPYSGPPPFVDLGDVVLEESARSHMPRNSPRTYPVTPPSISQPQDVAQDFTVMFIQPEEPIKKTVEPRIIQNSGREVISTEPSGKSEVELITEFLDQNEADEAFDDLQDKINWKQNVNKNRAGGEYEEPRLVAWYGEHPYAYSKVKMEANKVWPPMLARLKEKIERAKSLTFNSVLANMYRSEKDGVAWHSDDEYGLRDQPKIASLSLGETRTFEMRKKPPKGLDLYEYDYSDSDKLKIPLTHGSLLLMTGCTQDDWQHRIPKEYHARKMRINLTFRTIYQDERHQSCTDT